ncbi:DUF5710 domain-containing protein [Bacteroidota bacterium]
MSIQIEVPYQEKNNAKGKGAFWDNDIKTWYIPNSNKIDEFQEWIPNRTDTIIKTPILIAKNFRDCWKCKKDTPLIAIGGKEILVKDFVEDESDKIEWFVEDNSLALFYNIVYLPIQLIKIVQSKFPFFKYTYSKTIKGKYWANNCIHCNSIQGDFFNHCEPGGAFCPMSNEAGSFIKLFKIDYKHDIPIIGSFSFDDYNFIKTNDIELIVI